MTGELLGDRYQVGDTLGFGGMSEVHRGRDLRLGRDVAVKVLRADLARDPAFIARFRREAQNAASLNHPAIVAVYDTGETHGQSGPVPYIVMEYVDGETLRDVLKREGPMEPRRAMEITADVCAALDFSHRHGIVHRDVKPANVMLTRVGAVKVMDFGIARAVADGQATMTATQAVIGTAQYLSPEQARGEAVDARSDVYATGCVLYELLTGSPPFTGDSPVAVAYQHVREDPRPPSRVRPGLPPELDAIVLKALNKNPLNRYQTAAEMRADLVRALSGQAVLATPLLTDQDRTELMRATPTRVGPGGPPLLAPPSHAAPEPEWEEDSNRSRKVWGFVGIGVLVLALLAGAIYLTLKVTSAPGPTPQVSTPDVQGQTLEQATNTLTGVGLTVGDVAQVPSSPGDKGKVVSQNPSQRTLADKGSAVALQIGQGQSAVTVPNLAQLDAAQAQQQLAKVQLNYKQATAVSDAANAGKVIKQDPASGAQVPPGTVVTVTVGTGPKYVVVPNDIVGMQLDAATAKLKSLKLQVTSTPTDSAKPKNEVLSMNPQPGQQVQEQTPIALTVSNGSQFMMPDVSSQGYSVSQAEQALKDAGWNADNQAATNQRPTPDPSMWNKVIGQSPAANTAISRLASVTLSVGSIPTTAMPDLSNMTQGQAQRAVGGAGLVAVTFAPGDVSAAQAGHVQDQSIPPGQTIPLNQPVTVRIFQAPAPTTPPTTPPPGTTPPTTPSSGPGGGGGHGHGHSPGAGG